MTVKELRQALQSLPDEQTINLNIFKGRRISKALFNGGYQPLPKVSSGTPMPECKPPRSK